MKTRRDMSTSAIDVSKWLKDELGLPHMSEADLGNLMFHSRFGSLGRRFIAYAVECTLSRTRYPNLKAEQECAEAEKKYEEKRKQLHELTQAMEQYIYACEDDDCELEYLRARQQNASRISQTLQSGVALLDKLMKRSSIIYNPTNLQRLVNSNLMDQECVLDAYRKLDLCDDSDKPVTELQLTRAQERFDSLVRNIDMMHCCVGGLLHENTQKWNAISVEHIKNIEISASELRALEKPAVEVISLDVDKEEDTLLAHTAKLESEIMVIQDEIRKLYSHCKQVYSAASTANENELEDCVHLVQRVEEISAIVAGLTK